MPKTFRIRTTPGKDQNLHLNIEQDFDQLEILSLKLTQDDVYSPSHLLKKCWLMTKN